MTAAFVASLVAIAFASAGAPTVRAMHNAKLGRIVVDAHGRTLYVLSPETTRHLLCKTRECFEVWPPLTVPSRKTMLKKGAGVRGRLTILRRSNGMLQVVLNGMPLYHFAGDSKKGEAKGQHIHSFGGVWHVVPARKGTSKSKSMSWSGTSTTSTGATMTSSTEWPASTSSSATSSITSPTLSTTSTMSTTSTTVTKSTTTSCFYPPC